MVTLTKVNWMPEADFLCAQLASCGIETHVPDQSTASVLPLHGTALGGIRIQVAESDLEKAQDVLRELENVAAEQMIRCPECDSTDISYARVSWRFAALIILLLGIPFLWLRKVFTCSACGYQWQESKEQ